MKKVLVLFLLFSTTIFSQVKIGDNPSIIDLNSILELESTNKAFVLTRLTTNQMNAITPLKGAIIYNVDENCLFLFNDVEWKSMCNSYEGVNVTTSNNAPTNNVTGDFWINNENGIPQVNLWNGSEWVLVSQNNYSGTGVPNNATVLNPNQGNIYFDQTSGDVYLYNGVNWELVSSISANNGLTKVGNTIQLGGDLIKPTEITTTATNTLALQGLENEVDVNEVELVVVDKATGVLKKIEPSNLLREEEIVIIANDGQSQFSPPYPITNPKHIDVYRNGVRIDFTTINATTIEVESEAVCYKNDKIRIVQFY
ncbi:hypothetical protein SAMN05444411_106118 [Lutibacter oricola]|uniref:Uncharacterized protein n=1 Tax=Lutibacter oricola TaxID=762486 RepID=A0A1H3CBV7_9FLAO|nr:hypothetical protein [Lutibacter oricola]SDX51586.1 hypothetical protein SAMN05444411_106118 [Lutibacter oricola]